MAKSKIAISLDSSLLKLVDSKVDKFVIRSRSQAIEFFLKKGLNDQIVDTAVILLKGDQHEIALRQIRGKSLIDHQIGFFTKNGIKNIFIITQHSKIMNSLLEKTTAYSGNINIIEKESRGNAQALTAMKGKIGKNFVVMSGDTFNDFDLAKMIKKHSESDKLAMMGLMTREKASSYGTAILDGDSIVDFQEKPKHHSTNIVNAGIYIFKPEIFEVIQNDTSLEKHTFPKIARLKQLSGFFTYGEYIHGEELL
jgi:NDP-sugar pyrophosphorylase family protein